MKKKRVMAAVLALFMIFGASVTGINVYAEEQSDEYFLGIGSVSKMYATTAVMQLKDKGLVDLDAPVTDYIDDFKMADERYKDITVRMLMNHTSGLMGTVYYDSFRFDSIGTEYHENFLKILSQQRLKADPGEYNCYCNDGFTLLEIIVERVTGMSFTEYIEENICEPLDMNNTYTIWNAPDMENQVPYYSRSGIQMAPECTQLVGAGGILSTSGDLCRFGTSFFRGDETLLSEASKKEMELQSKTFLSTSGYGLGWDTVNNPDYEAAGVKVISKGGDTLAQHASLVVAPEEKISAAVISSGGASTFNQDIACALMDIALEEKGIKVEHPEESFKETLDKVPEEYLQYEDIYTYGSALLKLSFPEGKYMCFESLTAEDPFEKQYLYTSDDEFVKVTGDVESGTAVQEKLISTLAFEDIDGKIYVVDETGSAILGKAEDSTASDAAIEAWDERDGKSYYLYNCGYADSFYAEGFKNTLVTSEDASGFVNGYTIIDETHAMNLVEIPGDASRDINDIEIIEEDGAEILTYPGQEYQYISEDAIPVFDKDVKNVELTTGKASWFKLDGVDNTILKLTLPKNSSCYVYDQKGNIVYSSFMVGYGDSVPLPSYGMIVFVGETGSTVTIGR